MVNPAPHPADPASTPADARSPIVLEPASLPEAAEAMRALARDRRSVLFVGGGTELGLGAPPRALDAILRTRGLSGVREYAPSDQIVAVEAGMTIAALQAHLAPERQRLALDPPRQERATVGGVVAAGSFGPRRSRFGAVRDLVIGVTVVRADGVVTRGGGKVVKNVAGFDLPRLFCGSLGTLGLVAEVVFRVHPLPEASATVVFQGLEAADVRATVLALRAVAVEPTASAALGTEDRRFTLLVRFEGFAPGVRDQVDRTLGRAGAGAKAEGGEEAALWAGHDRLRTAGGVRVKATFAPAGLAQAVEALRPLAGGLREPALVVYPAIGVAFVGGELDRPGEALAAVVRAVESARRALQPLGSGALVIAEAPPELHARVDAWGPVPSAIEVMRRLKRELDPDGRLAPGRFVGGI